MKYTEENTAARYTSHLPATINIPGTLNGTSSSLDLSVQISGDGIHPYLPTRILVIPSVHTLTESILSRADNLYAIRNRKTL